MKKTALAIIGTMLVVCVMAQDLAMNSKPVFNLPIEKGAAFKWTLKEYSFGKIKVGVPVSHEFTFTNTGDTPLIISSVNASCGCTVTSYSKEPIEPGATGFVKATYNAAKVGQFTKTVTVNANTEESVVQLTIKGEVVETLTLE